MAGLCLTHLLMIEASSDQFDIKNMNTDGINETSHIFLIFELLSSHHRYAD